jgi:hypothetical protein
MASIAMLLLKLDMAELLGSDTGDEAPRNE